MYKGVCKPKIMMIVQMETDMLISDLGEDSSSGESKRNVFIKFWGYDRHDEKNKNKLKSFYQVYWMTVIEFTGNQKIGPEHFYNIV